MKPLRSLSSLALVLLAALPQIAVARDSEHDDDVQRLEISSSPDRPLRRPTIIDRSGKYVLQRDVFAQETAFIIRASKVTLDLNGHAIWGPGQKKGVGVQVEGVSTVAVLNGLLSKFGTGVRVVGSSNVRLERLQITGQDLGGTPPDIEVGIMIVNSRGVRAERNIILDTFLGLFVRGGKSAGNRLERNVITAGQNGQLGICYNPAPNEGAPGPRGDLVYNNNIARFHTGISMSAESVANILRENDIAFLVQAISEASPGTNALVDNTSIQTYL